MSAKENEPGLPSQTSGQLDKEEAWLWRIALLFLVLLATALAAESWERLQKFPYYVGLLPIAVLCLTVLFAGFAYGRRRRVAELKTLVRKAEERAAPSDEQIDHLTQVL